MALLTGDDRTRLRDRVNDPAFATAWSAVRKTADAALASTLEPPARGAGWLHNYFCPTHGTRLVYDPTQPHAHRCPTDEEVLSGDPYDAAWRACAHDELIAGMRAAALVWVATGDERYAEHVATKLATYNDRYARYRPHGKHAGKGRALGQSLDEAVWAIPLAWSYDAVRDFLDDDLRTRLESKLLRWVGNHLYGQLWRRIHNIECWHLAGLATVGVVLDEERFIAPALDDEHGLPAQLRAGVLDDGWWYEGSASYHFYTMRAVLALATALRHRVPELADQPRLREMFTAPLRIARTDLTLPALNDGWVSVTEPPGIGAFAPVYEQAWALWQEPAHADALARIYAAGTARASLEAFQFGPDATDLAGRVEPRATRSECFEASGYTVFRAGMSSSADDSDERWLLLKYGPHGGGHGHPDKLGLDLHAFGQRLAPDLGTPGYGVPTHRTWFRQTLSHNTVVIGEASQPPQSGRLVRFTAPEAADVGVAEAVASWAAHSGDSASSSDTADTAAASAYDGVAMRRLLLWRARYFVDVVLVSCPEARQIDLAWHHLGALESPASDVLEPADWTPPNATYAHLEDVHRLDASPWSARWRLGAVGTNATGHDPDGTQVLAARAPANPPSERMAFLLRRVHAARAAFVTVLEPCRGDGDIRSVRWHGNGEVLVELADHTDVWHLDLTGPVDGSDPVWWQHEIQRH